MFALEPLPPRLCPSHSPVRYGMPDWFMLRLPAHGHDHTDYDGSGHNHAQKVLEYDRTRVGPGYALLSPVSRRSGLYLYPRGVGGL